MYLIRLLAIPVQAQKLRLGKSHQGRTILTTLMLVMRHPGRQALMGLFEDTKIYDPSEEIDPYKALRKDRRDEREEIYQFEKDQIDLLIGSWEHLMEMPGQYAAALSAHSGCPKGFLGWIRTDDPPYG